MIYGREKRQMLAWLALLAPVPLPFSQSLEWPVLFLYTLFVVAFLQRLEQGHVPILPNWVLNVLGLVYLPLLFVDLRMSIFRSRPVTALLHLIMFLILVKLYSMRREKDKWHLLVATFFLFVGGMATSTHLTIGFYLILYMMLSMVVLARFALLHMLGAEKRPAKKTGTAKGPPGEDGEPQLRRPPQAVPYRLPLAAGTVLVVAIAIPTFATIPRLREPFLLGPGGGGSLIRTTGFSDSVDLSLTSSIRRNRAVVLRLKYSGDAAPAGEELRFKGATFDRYENRRWHRVLQHASILTPRLDDVYGRLFRLSEEPAETTVEIFRERMNSRGLLLPMEAVGVAIDQPVVNVDLGGAVFLTAGPADTIRYEAFLAGEPQIKAQLARADADDVSPLTALDQAGVTEGMRRLAREVMGGGTPEESVDRLERHLLRSYSYTLDFVGRDGETPLDDFLFKYKSGHCEYFASSMVLMLRAENIPARLATGFLGAEYNPLEGYYMVRQENAHAWVEAYTPSRGWQVYDPTPPEGRPVLAQRSLKQLLTQLYDYLTFRWDRYVLTYGAEDQQSFFQTLRERLTELWREIAGMSSGRAQEEASDSGGGVASSDDEVIREADLWLSRVPLSLTVAAFLAACAALVVWQRRRPLTGEAAYRRLRRRLVAGGLHLDHASAPIEVGELAVARYPGAAAPIRDLLGLYLRESFAESPLDGAERDRLKDLLRSARRGMAREDRERKRRRAPRPTR